MFSSKCIKYFCLIRFFKRGPLISAFLIIVLFSFPTHAFDIRLGTGETGTFSHFAGRTICRIINKHTDDINCQTVPTLDAVDNLTNLQGGSLDIGLIDSRMLHDAMNKTGYFEFMDISYDNLRTLVPLYNLPITLVVRSNAKITSLEALKGKRMNAGAPRSLQHLAFDTILKAKNWSKKDFRLVTELPTSQSQDTMAFCHGTIQAMVNIAVHPDSTLQQLFRLCKADLVDMYDNDIEKLVNTHPAYFKIDIAAGVYPSPPKGVTTFGTRAVLVASDNLDAETVYKIIDAIYNNRKRLESAHPALSILAVDEDQKSAAGIQLHPGAIRYFSEKGM